MGRMLTITNSRIAELGVKKKTLKREIVIGATAIKFITLAIFAVLAIVYLTQATAGANQSVKVQNIYNKTTDLQVKKEQLEVEKVRSQSLGQIDSNIQKPGPMEQATAVGHL